MARVLTTSSLVTCPHAPGAVQPLVSTARLSVDHAPVLTQTTQLKPIVGCVNPTAGASKTCLSVVAVTAGASVKLTVGGQPVLLDTLSGTTDGAPPPQPVKATANQLRLTAV